MKTKIVIRFFRILRNFKKFAEGKLLMFAWFVYNRVNGNANFPTPTPDMPTLNAAILYYAEMLNGSQTRDRTQVTLKNQAKADL